MINKTAGFVKCFFSGIFADSNIFYARHFNFCPKTKKIYKTDMCSCYTIARLCRLEKGALDSQPQVIEFTSCLPMVGGSLRVLRLPPPLKLVVMI